MVWLAACVQTLFLCLGARALGRIMWPGRCRFISLWLQLTAQTALGLLAISHLTFALVLLDFASPAVLRVETLCFAGLAIVDLAWLDRRLWAGRLYRSLGNHTALLVVVAGFCLWAVFQARIPPHGLDELIYHLEVPKQILALQGHVSFVDNIYGYFPQLGEMLFLLGLAVTGPPAAKLLHASGGLLLAFALYGYCRQTIDRTYSALAAAALLTVPSVMAGAAMAYVDLLFCLYAFLAFASLLEFLSGRRNSWLVLAGIFSGASICVKYSGIQLVLLLCLVVLVEYLWRRRKDVPWALLVLAGFCVVISSPYWLRNWVVTGWPLFPFDFGFLELNPVLNWDSNRSQLYLSWLSTYGAGNSGFVQNLASPILVFLQGRFGEFQYYDGVLGPVFLLVPLVVLRMKKSSEVVLMSGFSCFFLLYWTLTTQQVRFLLPVIPALSFLLAAGLAQWRSRLLNLAVILLVGFNAFVGIRHEFEVSPVPFWLGNETEESYLSHAVVGYPLYRAANEMVGKSERIYLVNMRNFGFLLDVPWRGDFVFEYFRLGQVLEQAEVPEDLLHFFEQQEVTHLMIDEEVTLGGMALPPRETEILRNFLETKALLLARNPIRPGQALWKIEKQHPVSSGPQ